MKIQPLSILALLATPIFAHKESSPALLKRHADLSKRCAGAAASFNKRRYERRNAATLEKRSRNSTYNIVTEAPYYDILQNDTCVLAPDASAGPVYWPRSDTLRQDMTEDQAGIPLTLDVGIMDMATCQPLPDALVEFWQCNATGYYSSFASIDSRTPLTTTFANLNLNITDFEIGVTDFHTDDATWLRGMWPSNDQGMVEMKTIFPGFYNGRAVHIHVAVYTDWVLRSNGTLSSGKINSVGQFFFYDSIVEKVIAQEPYVSRGTNRTTNAMDKTFAPSFANGYNPIVNLIAADGVDITKGMIGYITVGIDTKHIVTLGHLQ